MTEENQKYPAKILTKSTESFARFQQEIMRSEMLISYLEVANVLVSENSEQAKRQLTSIYYNAFNSEMAKKKHD